MKTEINVFFDEVLSFSVKAEDIDERACLCVIEKMYERKEKSIIKYIKNVVTTDTKFIHVCINVEAYEPLIATIDIQERIQKYKTEKDVISKMITESIYVIYALIENKTVIIKRLKPKNKELT